MLVGDCRLLGNYRLPRGLNGLLQRFLLSQSRLLGRLNRRFCHRRFRHWRFRLLFFVLRLTLFVLQVVVFYAAVQLVIVVQFELTVNLAAFVGEAQNLLFDFHELHSLAHEEICRSLALLFSNRRVKRC